MVSVMQMCVWRWCGLCDADVVVCARTCMCVWRWCGLCDADVCVCVCTHVHVCGGGVVSVMQMHVYVCARWWCGLCDADVYVHAHACVWR